jgi:phosphatidylserine/phosphatidylglycerophosphate/cardiolipin synthase-like enzyme
MIKSRLNSTQLNSTQLNSTNARRCFCSLLTVLCLFILIGCPNQSANTAVSAQSLPNVNAYFSPNGGCTEAIINEINFAKESILVQAYSFTSEPISRALIDAYKRGVKVEIVLDKSQRTENYSRVDAVAKASIPTFIDSKHAIAHNKIMILDGKTIITGSFNFTKGAEEKNAENLLIIKDQPELVRKYTDNYLKHKEHSEKY